jgi:hypothetical protein
MRRPLGITSLVLSVGLLASVGCETTLWVPTGPPAARVDVAVPAPGPGLIWIDGWWDWQGSWVWRPGRWERPPYPHSTWESGRWIHGRRGWRRTRGHWRRHR